MAPPLGLFKRFPAPQGGLQVQIALAFPRTQSHSVRSRG